MQQKQGVGVIRYYNLLQLYSAGF